MVLMILHLKPFDSAFLDEQKLPHQKHIKKLRREWSVFSEEDTGVPVHLGEGKGVASLVLPFCSRVSR